MAIYQFYREQKLKGSMDEVWNFKTNFYLPLQSIRTDKL